MIRPLISAPVIVAGSSLSIAGAMGTFWVHVGLQSDTGIVIGLHDMEHEQT